jgi:hypothetical protein
MIYSTITTVNLASHKKALMTTSPWPGLDLIHSIAPLLLTEAQAFGFFWGVGGELPLTGFLFQHPDKTIPVSLSLTASTSSIWCPFLDQMGQTQTTAYSQGYIDSRVGGGVLHTSIFGSEGFETWSRCMTIVLACMCAARLFVSSSSSSSSPPPAVGVIPNLGRSNS